MCNECTLSHADQCSSNDTIQVKYSHNENNLQPFCAKHDCFSYFYCKSCFTPVCTYCKEWEHDKVHDIIAFTEYVKKFIEPLQNCLETATQGKINHEKIKKDINSLTNEYAGNLKNHLTEVKFQLLSKFLYIFDCVEKQMKEEFEKVCENLQYINNEELQKYETILADINDLSQSSNIEKIIKTRLITETLSSMSESKDSTENGFTISMNPVLTNVQLEKILSNLIFSGVGSVDISFRNKSVTPKLEDIFGSPGFANLNNLAKTKQYCQTSGIFSERKEGENAKKQLDVFHLMN